MLLSVEKAGNALSTSLEHSSVSVKDDGKLLVNL